MSVPFSEYPGRHERHYRRRLQNPLFAQPTEPGDEPLLAAQRQDHDELVAFVDELRRTVQRAVDLGASEDSEVILGLKEDLERLYETSAGLCEDQESNQQAILHLLGVIMRTVSANAVGDTLAQQELAMEAQARALHVELLRHPLVADLLHPESVVEPDQLAATLLSESPQQVQAALTLFDAPQLALLADEAQALLDRHDPQRQRVEAWDCLALMRS
jgi:hypothetical protein